MNLNNKILVYRERICISFSFLNNKITDSVLADIGWLCKGLVLSLLLSTSLCFAQETISKGLISEQNQNKYDGGTRSFTLNKVGYEVDALITYGGGTVYTDATITTALSAIGTTTKATLVLRPGIWVISQNIDWSAYKNITLHIPNGTILSLADTKTCILGMPLKLDTPHQYWLIDNNTNCQGFRFIPEAIPDGVISPGWWNLINNSEPAAASNFTAIKCAWNAASHFITLGGSQAAILKFPSGSYYTTKIGTDMTDFLTLKTTSIVGSDDGVRPTRLLLANNQNTGVLYIGGNRMFNASIAHIYFNGNYATNGGTVNLVEIRGYGIDIHHISVYRSGGNGLVVAGGQAITIGEHVETMHNKRWGTIIDNMLNCTVIGLDSEYNNEASGDGGGLLITAAKSTTRDIRYQTPAITIENPYFEGNKVSLEIRGICGVKVNGGHGLNTKISRDAAGKPSIGNVVDMSGGVGSLVIAAGCHSNRVYYPNYGRANRNVKMQDSDGRNYIGPAEGYAAAELKVIPENYSGTSLLAHTNFNSGWPITTGSGSTWAFVPGSVLNNSISWLSSEHGPVHRELTTGDTASSTIRQTLGVGVFPTSTSTWLTCLVQIDGGVTAHITVTDTINGLERYNYETKTWEKTQHLIALHGNGKLQYFQFEIVADAAVRRPKITFSVINGYGGKVKLFYCNLSTTKDRGLCHVDNGVSVGYGSLGIFASTHGKDTRPDPSEVPDGTRIFDKAILKECYAYRGKWYDPTGIEVAWPKP